MSIGRIVLAVIVTFCIALVIYMGWWQIPVLFIWQHPMLSWLPLLALLLIGFAVGGVRRLTGGAEGAGAGRPSTLKTILALRKAQADGTAPPKPRRRFFAWGWGLLAGLVVLLTGLFFTLVSPPASGLDEIDYEVVDQLPQRSQPRLLPRTSVDDDPRFDQAKEVHLVRDPETGELLWTGEWQAAIMSGPSSGVAVKSLDDVISQSEIVRAGFDHSVAGIAPGTLKWEAKLDHPFSRIQYPVLVPTADDEAVAVAPYMGYRGFPFRYPYLKGVLVYHQDGTIEDLSPEEAAARPELARSGRIFPEKVARAQADALSRSAEFEGDIEDGEGNRQPFLTAIDRERTAWVTIINDKDRSAGVKAVVIADSSTGETEVWVPPEGRSLISTRQVLDEARALPLQWEETRCCDSEGHSYEVQLREVVEPRLAFKDGKPYYLVTVAPTDELALNRQVEYTLLIDAQTGKKLDQFEHVNGPQEDARLQRFFR